MARRSPPPPRPAAPRAKRANPTARPSALGELAVALRGAAGWIMAVGASAGLIFAALNSYANWQTQDHATLARIVAAELRITELSHVAPRVVAMDTRLAELSNIAPRMATIETKITSLTPLREQQLQGLTDRVRGLEASDTVAVTKMAEFGVAMARAMERLEAVTGQLVEIKRAVETPRGSRMFWAPPDQDSPDAQDPSHPPAFRGAALPAGPRAGAGHHALPVLGAAVGRGLLGH